MILVQLILYHWGYGIPPKVLRACLDVPMPFAQTNLWGILTSCQKLLRERTVGVIQTGSRFSGESCTATSFLLARSNKQPFCPCISLTHCRLNPSMRSTQVTLSRNTPQGRQIRLRAALIAATAALASAEYYADSYLNKKPYNTSKLSGQDYLDEILESRNPHVFREQLGLNRHVFSRLVQALKTTGRIRQTKAMTPQEQVAIFIYMVVTNTSTRKVGYRFQRSTETVSRSIHMCFGKFI